MYLTKTAANKEVSSFSPFTQLAALEGKEGPASPNISAQPQLRNTDTFRIFSSLGARVSVPAVLG